MRGRDHASNALGDGHYAAARYGAWLVSFSAGLATRTRAAQSLDEVIAAADVALYEAKNGGRNLVRLDRETYRLAASSVLRALYGAAWRQEQFNAGTDLRAD